MKVVQRRLIVGLFALLLVGVLVPGMASAASGRTVYVDDTGVANPTGKGACGKPNYNSIQAAVDDASVKQVIVCKGTYVEQVTVKRSLTLQGRSGAVIQAPANVEDAIVLFLGPQKSRLTGFTITGAGNDFVPAGVRATGFVGDEVAYGPTQVTISKNHITDIRDLSNDTASGTGIFLYKAQGDVSDNTVERYGFGGIIADGGDRADTSAQIDGNIIRGQGKSITYEAQVGIRLDETKADVEDNTITGNYGLDGRLGTGIQVIFANSSIRDNKVTDNYTGVALGPGDGTVLRSNVIRKNETNGIELFSTLNATIVENESSNNGGNGIFIASNAHTNTIKNNKAQGNGNTDIFDANGTPLVNTYISNSCGTSNPSGLCK